MFDGEIKRKNKLLLLPGNARKQRQSKHKKKYAEKMT